MSLHGLNLGQMVNKLKYDGEFGAEENTSFHAFLLGVAVYDGILNAHHFGHKCDQKPESRLVKQSKPNSFSNRSTYAEKT